MSNNRGKWRNSSTGEVVSAPPGYFTGKTDETRWRVKGEGADDLKDMHNEIEREVLETGSGE